MMPILSIKREESLKEVVGHSALNSLEGIYIAVSAYSNRR